MAGDHVHPPKLRMLYLTSYATIHLMPQEKLSVTVHESLVEFVETYRTHHDVRTKSEVVERALRLLRERELEADYAAAAAEADPAWDATDADGLPDDDWT